MILKKADEFLAGSICSLYGANEKLKNTIDDSTVEQFKSDPRLESSEEDLKNELSESIHRIEKIEEKASKNLLTITLAVSVIGTLPRILWLNGNLAQPVCIRVAIALFFTIVMMYFVGSGFQAVAAYRIGKLYRPDLQDLTIEDKHEKAMIFLWCVEQNYRAGTLRSNHLSASFSLLINGLVVVLLLGLLIISVSFFPHTQAAPSSWFQKAFCT